MSSEAPGDPATRLRILDAALRLVTRQGGAEVTLGEVAREAGVSRQALYLHFADRAALFLAVVRHADDRRGLPAMIRRIQEAPTGEAALREMAAMQARMNPGIWPLARALDSVRRLDDAAERSWQERLSHRLDGCRAIVAQLVREGSLRADLSRDVAADLLWTLSSLRTWEDLVLLRGWSAQQYEQRLGDLVLMVVTSKGTSARIKRVKH
ncbi:MAG TPA: helix-turn-helix domain-containing protein [Vicinamibacterales bacterium]|nr:helix-turn-helix domain-containing protein [Vicinamibacterales bacterium]